MMSLLLIVSDTCSKCNYLKNHRPELIFKTRVLDFESPEAMAELRFHGISDVGCSLPVLIDDEKEKYICGKDINEIVKYLERYNDTN